MEKLKVRKLSKRGIFAIVCGIVFSAGAVLSVNAQAFVPHEGTSQLPIAAQLSAETAPEVPPGGTTENDNRFDDIRTDIRINGLQIRWNGVSWMYFADGGLTWTDTPPEGVHVGENGGMTIWRGEEVPSDFDIDAFRQDVDERINSVLYGINRRIGSIIKKDLLDVFGRDIGSNNDSYIVIGDTIARQVDRVWEFSHDNRETWTHEPPENVEISECGTWFRIKENSLDDLNVDERLSKRYNDSKNNTVHPMVF